MFTNPKRIEWMAFDEDGEFSTPELQIPLSRIMAKLDKKVMKVTTTLELQAVKSKARRTDVRLRPSRSGQIQGGQAVPRVPVGVAEPEVLALEAALPPAPHAHQKG